ncbi:hypothetical protein DFH08DRAFT_215910 [Mycena albidolilacea]|uniref:Uncharacterized protein n=1 Tax=Mycena albidolilacea TaxID=1033008 RepID=A0AAD6ZY92_9AGAR|nr:hypothetical protein DFH08DRAFT_215910 [Mycena albidolilacea]
MATSRSPPVPAPTCCRRARSRSRHRVFPYTRSALVVFSNHALSLVYDPILQCARQRRTACSCSRTHRRRTHPRLCPHMHRRSCSNTLRSSTRTRTRPVAHVSLRCLFMCPAHSCAAYSGESSSTRSSTTPPSLRSPLHARPRAPRTSAIDGPQCGSGCGASGLGVIDLARKTAGLHGRSRCGGGRRVRRCRCEDGEVLGRAEEEVAMGSADVDAPNGKASRTTQPIAAAQETRTGTKKEIPARAARPPSRCRYRAPSPPRPAAQERHNAVSRVYTLDGREHHPIHRADNRHMLMLRRVPVRRASPRPLAASAPLTPSTDTNLSFPPFLLPGVVLRSISFPGCADVRTCDEKGEAMRDGGGSSGRRRRASTLRPRTTEHMQNVSEQRDAVASRRHRRNRESAKETNQ